MDLKKRYQDFPQLVKQSAQELQSLKNIYQRLDYNDMKFYCANITGKNLSARTEDDQNGNKYDKSNNCERNARENNCERNMSNLF